MNGGTNHADNPATYTADSPDITLKNPTRAGYTFKGWTPTNTIPHGSTGNKTFTANWEAIVYNITYVMNGGTNHADNPKTYTVEQLPITLKDPTRAGYTFGSWTPSGNIPVGTTGDLTFTANWLDADEYSITYIMNGGSNHPDNPVKYTVESDTITLDAYEHDTARLNGEQNVHGELGSYSIQYNVCHERRHQPCGQPGNVHG